jgi:hypothetical protein
MNTPPLLLQTGDKGTGNSLRTVAAAKESRTVAKITQMRTSAVQYCVIANKHAEAGPRLGSLMLLSADRSSRGGSCAQVCDKHAKVLPRAAPTIN